MSDSEYKILDQCGRVSLYLEKHGSITPLESWTRLGIYRLSDVILKLRKRGHLINTQYTAVKNRFGEDIEFARYLYVGVKWPNPGE